MLCLATVNSAYAADNEGSEGPDAAALDAKRASARQLATEASKNYRMGRFQEAYDGFDRAFRLVGVPALGVWSARSLRQMNRLVEASERYRDVLKASADAPESHQKALKDARAELDELLPRIPNLVIRLKNADAEQLEVTLDGRPVDAALIGAKQRIDPGKHALVARRGDEVIELEVELKERETKESLLEFQEIRTPAISSPAAPHSVDSDAQSWTPMQTGGVVTMAVGGASLIAGIVTTVIALGQQSDLEALCPDLSCPPSAEDELSSYNTMKTTSVITLVGAGVLGATGATLFVLGQPDETQPQLSLGLRGTGLHLKGSF